MTFRLSLKAISFLTLLIVIPALSNADQFKVTLVYDGDTIAVVENGRKIRVRLVGIDSPETSKGKNKPAQPFNQKSKNYLSWLILNETIEIKSYGIDRYGRILGVVYYEGDNINLEMVKEGYGSFSHLQFVVS